MGISIRQALTLDPLKNTKIVAGFTGLDREIWLVNVMEVPDIFNWVSANELILTTCYPFKDSPSELVDLICKLNEKNITGLAIKPNRFIKELPKEVIETADTLDFPILSLPSDAQFDKIILGLLTEIINNDYQVIKKGEEIHQALTKLVLGGGKVPEIAHSLASLCFGEIVVKDAPGKVLARAKPVGIAPPDSQNTIDCDKHYEKKIQLNNQVISVITLSSWRSCMEKEDIVAIDYASNIIAMTMLKHENFKEKQKRYRNDFLNDLIHERFTSCEAALSRGKHFGLHLTLPHVVFIFSPDTYYSNNGDLLYTEEFLEHMDKIIGDAFIHKGRKCIHWCHTNTITVLCPALFGNEEIKKENLDICQEVKKIINDELRDLTVTVGIGTCYTNIIHIGKSYQEATLAIETGRKVWGSNGIYHYDDLGIYQLLVQLSDQTQYTEFIHSRLGKLLEHDQKKNTELMQTLEQLLYNDNLKIAAEKLYIHPKTLVFRKNRIQEILNVNLDDPEKRLTLSVAIKLYRLTLSHTFTSSNPIEESAD